MDITCLDFGEIVMKHLGHRGACDIGALLWKSAVSKITARMLRIRQIHIGDDVNYAAVRLLRKAFVLAAVTGLHVEDRDVKTFRANDRETAVRVAENQYCVRFGLGEKLV